MRYLGIKVGNNAVMFPQEAAQLLGHLGNAFTCSEHWKEGRTQWVKSDEPPEVVFLDSSKFEQEPEPMEALRLEKEQATKNWLQYYHKNTELEKELKAAKEQLEKLKKAAQEIN